MQARWLAVALAALLVAPAAAATWRAHGSHEPDTRQDATGGWMWLHADATRESSTAKRVYFNAVPVLTGTGINPNVGHELVQSRVAAAGMAGWTAYLGIWKDCNRDGYIGRAEGVVLEYASVLLTDHDVCPDGGLHNRNGWVYEFRWIGPADTTPSPDPSKHSIRRSVNDTDARVWGDVHLPGNATFVSCDVAPVPRGTFSSTGGLLRYADCTTGRRVAELAGETFDDLDVPLPVSPFGDPDAGRPGTWGADTGRPAFTAFDCSDPERGTPVRDPTAPRGQRGALSDVTVHDPTGGMLSGDPLPLGVTITLFPRAPGEGGPGYHRVYIADERGDYAYVPPAASDPAPDTEGSLYDALNATENDLVHRCRDGRTLPSTVPFTNVTTGLGGRTLMQDLYRSPEGDVGDAPVHRATDFAFLYNHPAANVQTVSLLADYLGPDAPADLGFATYRGAASGMPGWNTPNTVVTPPQAVDRSSLQPQGALWFTFYARLGPATLEQEKALTPASRTSMAYGYEWCGDAFGDRIVRGFDCLRSRWWNPDHGAPSMPVQRVQGGTAVREMGVRAGDPYHMRDIDCFDGRLLRGQPLYASLAPLASVCPDL